MRRGATWQVWVKDLSSGRERKLTGGNCNAFSPVWGLTSREIVFAGDCRRGQSLVVWAFNEGRGAARECDRYLMGNTDLP